MKAYLEPDEVEKLEGAAKYVRDKLLIRLLFHSGARISEVISLELKNVDFSQREKPMGYRLINSEMPLL